MSREQLVLKVRGYKRRGKDNTLDMNADRSIKNDSFTASLMYFPKEKGIGKSPFHSYIKFINIHNFVKVDIVDALVVDGTTHQKGVIPEDAKEDLKLALNGVVELTPEQKKIKELEDKINKMIGIKSDEDVKTEEEQMAEAKAEYERLYGEKPHQRNSLETILTKIKEFKPE